MKARLVTGLAAVGVLVALWVCQNLIGRAGRAARRSRTARRKVTVSPVRVADRRDVFLSRDDLLEIARFGRTAQGSSGTATDTKAALRHPGWRTLDVLDRLLRTKVVSMRSATATATAIECQGVWLRPSGVVLVVRASECRDEVLAQAIRSAEEAASETHIYLSRQDVFDLAHGNFNIPIKHGYHHRHVERRYPGWSWNELHGALHKGRYLARKKQAAVPASHLPAGFVGVLIARDGTVVLDDGSLEHPARTRSWERRDRWRLSEHCEFRGPGRPSPVIIHAPHTSRHIPDSVRAELLLDERELVDELAAMTDSGVTDVLDHLLRLAGGAAPTVVAATMSRLVFDPERFPVGDEMEAVGMGLVYTRRADGSPLRAEPAPERLDWYRAQHRAYTETLERVVESAVGQYGTAVVIDLHSYPKDPLNYEDHTRARPEVCIGTDPVHTPEWLLTAATEIFKDEFDVGINTPFSGAYVPGRFYGTDQRVLSVMIEVRRDVLDDPARLERVAAAVQDLTARLGTSRRENHDGVGADA